MTGIKILLLIIIISIFSGCSVSRISNRQYEISDVNNSLYNINQIVPLWLIKDKHTFYLSNTKKIAGAFGPYWFKKKSDTLILYTITTRELDTIHLSQYILDTGVINKSADILSTNNSKVWSLDYRSKYLKDTLIGKRKCYVFSEIVRPYDKARDPYRKIYIDDKHLLPVRLESGGTIRYLK